jgi:acyl transferase domain-containing protein
MNGDALISEIDGNSRETQLTRISQIYTRGADLAWERLYSLSHVNKVSLPTYEFQKLRCWPSFTYSKKVLN